MRDFIDTRRDDFGVEPICKALQIAPSGYPCHTALLLELKKRCTRIRHDEDLASQIQRVWQATTQVCVADKVCEHINRVGTSIARCMVEQLVRNLGIQSVRRSKVVRTTCGDANAHCPLDRVNRQFEAFRPNQLWVAAFGAQALHFVHTHQCLLL